MTTEKEIVQVKEIIRLLETTCNTNGYVGVEIDNVFDNSDRFTKDYTMVHFMFENILDEIFVLTSNIKNGNEEDLFGLTSFEATRHVGKLVKFITDHSRTYFEGKEAQDYKENAVRLSK